MHKETKTVVYNVIKSFNMVKDDINKLNNYLTDISENTLKIDVENKSEFSALRKKQDHDAKEILKLKDMNKALKAELRFMQKKLKKLSRK